MSLREVRRKSRRLDDNQVKAAEPAEGMGPWQLSQKKLSLFSLAVKVRGDRYIFRPASLCYGNLTVIKGVMVGASFPNYL